MPINLVFKVSFLFLTHAILRYAILLNFYVVFFAASSYYQQSQISKEL